MIRILRLIAYLPIVKPKEPGDRGYYRRKKENHGIEINVKNNSINKYYNKKRGKGY